MPPAAAQASASLALIWGDDDFSVKKRARQIYQEWCRQAGGMDHETIDGSASNSGDALRSIHRLREAMQTLPFFGSAKVIWWQNLNILGEERVAAAKIVTETLAEVAQELKSFKWENVRLLISAGKVDKRRTFYKTLEKAGLVEAFAELTTEDRDWAYKAEAFARGEFKILQKDISAEALDELVACVGPNTRQLRNEIEKLALFAGDRKAIQVADVEAIVTRQKQSQAFALGEALGDRDLPRLLKALDEALWEMKFDSQKSAIGILYGFVTKIRVLIFLKEMVRLGRLKPTSDMSSFKAQLEKLPADLLPADKRLNPLSMHPYVLFKALPQIRNYSTEELIQAMEGLLECNLRLISSSTDESLVLQQTLVRIVTKG